MNRVKNKQKNKLKYLSGIYVFWMIVFTVIPLLLIIYFSFTTTEGKFPFENIKFIVEFTHMFLS